MKKLDLSFRNNEQAKRGSVLISDPFLDDAYFSRSVIILCEHNNDGSFGFVLNNFIDIDLNKIDEKFPDIDTKISFGGPVAKENLFFIHSLGPQIIGSVQVSEDIYYGGDYDQICDILTHSEEARHKVRFFIGYSGWSEGQLENELNEHSWIPVNNIEASAIFNTSDTDLWKHCLEKQGERFKMISKFPLNPRDN